MALYIRAGMHTTSASAARENRLVEIGTEGRAGAQTDIYIDRHRKKNGTMLLTTANLIWFKPNVLASSQIDHLFHRVRQYYTVYRAVIV